MRIALTGHRPQRLGLPDDENSHEWDNISDWIEDQIIDMLGEVIQSEEKMIVYSGMANGCDIVLAMDTVALKQLFGDLKLHCVLPCKDYNSSNKYYETIKDYSDEWVELSDEFYKGCDNVRDQYMVDHCDVLLAIWDGNKFGGVWSTIRKAQKAGKKIIYCPKEILEGE